MAIFRRRQDRPAPERVPLVLPGLDGTGWPEQAAGRPSFGASAYAEMGQRRAYDPVAHELAGRLLAAALPLLSTGASAQDEPYLAKVLLTAARLGVGLGLVEREATGAGPTAIDPAIAGALGAARRGLPAMREDWARTSTWFLLAGHYLARQDAGQVDAALRALAAQAERAGRGREQVPPQVEGNG